MLQKFSSFFEAASQLRAFLNIRRSGLFNAETYRQLNPACKFGDTACLWHWVRHGIFEDRPSSQDAFTSWALYRLARHEISVKTVKKLYVHSNKETYKQIYHENGININEIHYFEHMGKNIYPLAEEALLKTNGLFFLRKTHSALRKMPALKNIKSCYEKAKADPTLAPEALSADDLKKLYDIAFTAGTSWQELCAFAQEIELKNTHSIPIDYSIKTDFTLDYTLYRQISLHNYQQTEKFYALHFNGKGIELVTDAKDPIIVFLPEPKFWAGSDAVQGFIKSCFGKIMKLLLEKSKTLIILPAPFGHDLTHVQLPFDKCVSYHTYGYNRSNMLHYKEGSVRGSLLLDPQGYSGASACVQMKTLQKDDKAHLEKIRHDYKTTAMTKYDQIGDLTSIPDTKYIFIAMQVADDSVRRWQHLSSIEIVTTLTDAIISGVLTLPYKIVAKIHPYDHSFWTRSVLDELVQRGLIHLSDAPIQDLIAGASIVITANSGVGLEALLLEKPVIATGDSEYSAGAVLCDTAPSLIKAVSNLTDHPTSFDHQHAENVLATLFAHHMIDPFSGDQDDAFARHVLKTLNLSTPRNAIDEI